MDISLEDFLLGLSSNYSNIFYHENGGNAGDALINVGFYHLAEKIGLKYQSIGDELCDFKKGDVVLVAGGGCIVPEWDSVPEYISAVLETEADLVILPQSINGREELLKKLRKNDVVILREKYSYDYCSKLDLESRLFVSKDTAFYLQVEKLNVNNLKLLEFMNVKNAVRLMLILYHYYRSIFCKTIDAYRCDSEASNNNVKRKLYNDLSLVCSFGANNYNSSFLSASLFLKVLSRYEKINTDRLHVMVGGVLLNKKVIAQNNNYYKLKGKIGRAHV